MLAMTPIPIMQTRKNWNAKYRKNDDGTDKKQIVYCHANSDIGDDEWVEYDYSAADSRNDDTKEDYESELKKERRKRWTKSTVWYAVEENSLYDKSTPRTDCQDRPNW